MKKLYLYLAVKHGTNQYKIGCAYNLQKKIKNLCVSENTTTDIIQYGIGDFRDEFNINACFCENKQKDGWLILNSNDVKYIQNIIKTGKYPKNPFYNYRAN